MKVLSGMIRALWDVLVRGSKSFMGERLAVASDTSTFSIDHATARQRFRQAALNLGWQVESHPIGAIGPEGEELAFDVACSTCGDPEKVLVVSTGVHGVEGFFGSAVQVALLERWATAAPPSTRCVFLHGLNPYGFAWLRRFDENNVDPNRNYLLPGERFEGVPEVYARLDSFLNPRCPPSRWDPFTMKAMGKIARYGLKALRQAIAGGQFRYPRGLFFGGAGPSRTQRLLAENMPRWLAGGKFVAHLDFHTGLGKSGACKLLIDYPLSERQQGWLTDWFGAKSFEPFNAQGIAYETRGGFGRWCVSSGLAPDYLFACAEFGTYGPVRVLAGLRAENQAHHWGEPGAASTVWAKARLKELFCPASKAWRSKVLHRSLNLVDQAHHGLIELDLAKLGAGTPDLVQRATDDA